MSDSELWKKIKAARDFAELTQDDVGELMNVSRSAISMWEKKNPKGRTHPSVRQIHLLAKACGVPAEFFWRDDMTVGDLYRVGDRNRNLRTLGLHAILEAADKDVAHSPRLPGTSPTPAAADESRRAAGFWSATEFFLPPEKAIHVNMSITVGGLTTTVSYCDGPNLLVYAPAAQAGSALGALLIYARALRAEPKMHLLLWGQSDLDAEVIREVFGAHVHCVNSPTEAADYIKAI
jgi:transcriptional regulator with XRE-family HTH domain